MQCGSCMTVNPAGNRYCENCGRQLQLTCGRCGHDARLLARFCGNCGNALQSAAAAAEGTPKWGELKQATVLFADIVGSTDMVAHMDPEEAMARLRPAVLRMRHSVERFGGTVLRTLGDGVMAMFGVPRSLEGHALLACQAALHMQAAFRQGGDGLSIRVGLHSGQVASDPEDAEDGRGGGAHGLTIHLASRVIGLAQPGGVCITLACRQEAGPGCVAQSMGPHRLKGIPEPVEILALQGVEPGARRAPLGPGPVTFRGRERELALLQRALDDVGAPDAPNVLGIVGEPGAGKSRLCAEFARACRSRGVAVHEVRAQLYGHALPLQPILELFRTHFFGIGPEDADAAARMRIDAAFEPLAPGRADLELLHEFFRVAAARAEPLALQPRARQARIAQLLQQLVRHAGGSPRVILIEDLHWIDEGSEALVAALVEAVAGTRTLLLLNYRPAWRPSWDAAGHREIRLGELPGPDMDALVAELLADVTPLPDVCRLVCRRSGGNPFFAEELVRTIAESGVIPADTGLPPGGIEAVERVLPATLQAVIGARLDRLGEPGKTLLQMCAIIGKEIPLAVLQHVASPIASRIEQGLDDLCRAGLIAPQPTPGSFAFRHPLIQEVAYTTQLKVRRGQVHAGVAEAMERYYGSRLDEYAALISYHFEQAGAAAPAARYSARAAAWLGSTHAAQSIRLWRKVRTLLEGAEETDDVQRQRVTAGAKIATLGWREGMTLAEVKPLIDEAVRFANAVDDRLLPWLMTVEGRMVVADGGPADAYVDCAKKALLYIDVDRDPGRVALAHAFLCQAYAWAGLLRESLAASDVALANSAHVDAFDREFIGFDIEQWVLGMRMRVLARLGRAADAHDCHETMRTIAATSGLQPVPGMASMALVELAWADRDGDLAGQQQETFARILQSESTPPYVAAFCHGYSGVALALGGAYGEAMARFEQALALVRSSGAAKEYEAELLAAMAECLLHAGEAQRAHACAGEAVQLARARSTRVAECRALIARLQAAEALGVPADDVGAERARVESLLDQTGAGALRAALDRVSARNAARAA